MVGFHIGGETGTERTDRGLHGCSIHLGMGFTEGQSTDCVQQRASHFQRIDIGNSQSLFECHDSPSVPKQDVQATEVVHSTQDA
eukprot:15360922-Ditylum_brightwellii.AAC.1